MKARQKAALDAARSIRWRFHLRAVRALHLTNDKAEMHPHLPNRHHTYRRISRGVGTLYETGMKRNSETWSDPQVVKMRRTNWAL